MKAKEFIPTSKPRNFVAKNQKTAGAGAHKDKKKAAKQGDVKHKAKQFEQGVAEDHGDPQIKPGMKTQYGTVISVEGNTVTVKASNGELTTVNIQDIDQAMAESTVELNPGEDPHYFRVRHQTKRDIELEMPPKAWDAVGPAYATYEEAKEAFEQLKAKHPNERFTYTQHPRISHMGGVAKRVFPEEANMEARDPEDWDEGNTEPPNNFAVYINGKKWKVFKGRGYYADDERERQHYYQLKDWAAKKTAATGKKWEVSITGEPATE
jgi:hypothetical protein